VKENNILFDHHLAQTNLYPFALEIIHAEGVWLTAKSGQRYMDLISGVGVSNLGHGNQFINDAIKKQIDRFMHVMVYGEYIQQSQIDAATELTSILPSSLDCCYFVNSGTEANEAALKLAKRITGRTQMISCVGAYHGNTHGSMSVSWNEIKKSPFRPLLPCVSFIRFNHIEDLEFITDEIACVIIETIQGDAGIRIPDQTYLEALRKKCNETGTQLIFDEIQCGMGRTGSYFAFEQFGVTPDILTLGKALGGGMPVGCVVSSRDKMKLFSHDPMLGHISTFAGHPVICAAVAANIQFMKQEQVVVDVNRKGNAFVKLLEAHPRVQAIRNRGLFFAIDLHSPEEVQHVVDHCLRHGVITFWFLSCPASFRIAPPLTISDHEIELACQVILDGLSTLP
jgi:acetylornithine/N-succinyldiaminopimelate aminotransferase